MGRTQPKKRNSKLHRECHGAVRTSLKNHVFASPRSHLTTSRCPVRAAPFMAAVVQPWCRNLTTSRCPLRAASFMAAVVQPSWRCSCRNLTTSRCPLEAASSMALVVQPSGRFACSHLTTSMCPVCVCSIECVRESTFLSDKTTMAATMDEGMSGLGLELDGVSQQFQTRHLFGRERWRCSAAAAAAELDRSVDLGDDPEGWRNVCKIDHVSRAQERHHAEMMRKLGQRRGEKRASVFLVQESHQRPRPKERSMASL